MSHCPDCAELQRQVTELKRVNLTYRAAIGEIQFLTKEVLQHASALSLPLESLELTVRTSNILRAAGIKTVGNLANWTLTTLKQLPGMGRKSLTEIQETLAQYRIGLNS